MGRYLAITGGVGGAKLALGLAHVLSPDEADVDIARACDVQQVEQVAQDQVLAALRP